jgi:hypothetical protein
LECNNASAGQVLPQKSAGGGGFRRFLGPLPDLFIRLLNVKVPAGGIGKEKTIRFPEAPLTEVLDLVGFALPDKNDGEPAAALAAMTAGAARESGGIVSSSPPPGL